MTPPKVTSRYAGYALLMTLLLLAIAASALAITARASTAKALDALDAADALQRKWAWRSCETFLLPHARDILKSQYDHAATEPQVNEGASIGVVHRSLTLGNLTVDLAFADENAKLNVNTLLARMEAQDAARVLDKLLRDQGLQAEIKLRPIAATTDKKPDHPIVAFDQVFTNAAPAQLTSGIANSITCWGNGKVNFRGASRAVLAAALRPDAGPIQVERLLEIRRTQPNASLGTLLSQLELTGQQRSRLESRLCDKPDTFSLWVILHDGRRSWYHLIPPGSPLGTTPAPGSPIQGNATSGGGGNGSAVRLYW